MATVQEKTGVAIVLVSALGAALSLVFTHVNPYVASGVAPSGS